MAIINTGEIIGSTVATQFPDIYFGYQAWIAGIAANTGKVYIGNSSAVAVVGSTATNATAGFEITATRLICFQGPGNLNNYWYICSSTSGANLSYMVESPA